MSFIQYLNFKQRELQNIRNANGPNDEEPNIDQIIAGYGSLCREFRQSGYPHRSDADLYNDGIDGELERIIAEAHDIIVPYLPPAEEAWTQVQLCQHERYVVALNRARAIDSITANIRLLVARNALAAEFDRVQEELQDDYL